MLDQYNQKGSEKVGGSKKNLTEFFQIYENFKSR
jgi:hypothetical protein